MSRHARKAKSPCQERSTHDPLARQLREHSSACAMQRLGARTDFAAGAQCLERRARHAFRAPPTTGIRANADRLGAAGLAGERPLRGERRGLGGLAV